MKKFLASVCGGAALVAFLAGCDPHLAQIENGSEEALWYKKMKENYPQFTPPRTPAPAVYTSPNWNNVSRQNGAAVPADDPEQTVDSAAECKNVKALRDVEELPAGGKEKSVTGNTPAVATDNLVVTDTFDPIITINSVTLDGVPLSLGTGYTYDQSTGLFETVQSVITVPAATYVQNSDGSYTTVPGTATLTVNGTI